jgi:ATP adenylyltransferase/5',5'''-P-1,P-4-tetraphosphate phosphorylase II
MFGPGSDIVKGHAEQIVGTIGGTHTLALNAFPVSRPQYLLLENDPGQSQNDPLRLVDIEACWAFLAASEEPYFAMYNCTKDAGCSRYHKHMQIMKKPEVAETAGLGTTGFQFFPDTTVHGEVPYAYFIRYFESSHSTAEDDVPARMFCLYQELLRLCRQSLQLDPDDTTRFCPHNAIISTDWLLVIPRRSNECNGVGANATGMLGMPTVSSRELLHKWEEVGPANVLRTFGVPRL